MHIWSSAQYQLLYQELARRHNMPARPFYILCAEITVPSALTKKNHYSSEIRSAMRDMLEKVWGVGTVAIRMDSRAGAIRATENDDKAKVSVRSIKWQTQFECGTVIILFFKQAHSYVKTNRRKMLLRGSHIYVPHACYPSWYVYYMTAQCAAHDDTK